MAATRRLAAILVADIVGYARLIGADEEGTHERVKSLRQEVFEPRIAGHQGRVVKSTGDGLLVEFSSAVEAVRCAVEVQRSLIYRNIRLPAHERIAFRIGINVGDVIVEADDIFGDGVNIAARLEAFSEPDGICISEAAHDQIRDKLPYRFEALGPQRFKNISRPVNSFALRAADIAHPPVSTPTGGPASPATLFSAPARPQAAPRLSTVVLPFANLGDDPAQQYLADAITEDLTTDLSRISEMIVISRTTAFTYRHKPVDAKQIGRELNIRYVLEGSVRRFAGQVRVNAQLIDAESDAHVWAERFDHNIDNLFALQDEVTSRIAVALNVELIDAEAGRATEQPDVLDYILRGRSEWHNGQTPQHLARAIDFFERALVLDPDSVNAKALLAAVLAGRVLDQMSPAAGTDTHRAEALAEEALRASPRNPLAYFAQGQTLRAQNKFEAAIPYYEAAVALNRNWVLALGALGHCRFLVGAIEESIPAQQQAIHLSPRDPYIGTWYWRIGMVHLLQSRPTEAIEWIEKARQANPKLAGPHAWLASAYALTGAADRASASLAEARRLSGDGRYSTLASFDVAQSLGTANRTLVQNTFFAGLRLAGVPEE
jgi:adenylate cyclase